MRTLTLRFKNYGKEAIFDSIRVAKKGTKKIEPDVIYFNDIDDLRKFLSSARTEMIQAIRELKPESIYELSQKMGKDQGYVSKEVHFLNQMGIVDLETTTKGGRERTSPVVKFDQINVELGLDEFPRAGNG